MQVKILATYEGGETVRYVSEKPETRQLYRIKTDVEIEDYARQNQSTGTPAVVRMQPFRGIPFTERMQRAILAVNNSGDEREDLRVFPDLCDTWLTPDNAKLRDCWCISEPKVNIGKTAVFLYLLMEGNVVMGTEQIADGTQGIRAGREILKVQTLHPDDLPDLATMPYEGNEHFIHDCTIVRKETLNGKNMLIPFSQKGGKVIPPYMPTRTVVMARHDVYIDMKFLEKLPLGMKPPNIYNPAVWE